MKIQPASIRLKIASGRSAVMSAPCPAPRMVCSAAMKTSRSADGMLPPVIILNTVAPRSAPSNGVGA